MLGDLKLSLPCFLLPHLVSAIFAVWGHCFGSWSPCRGNTELSGAVKVLDYYGLI